MNHTERQINPTALWIRRGPLRRWLRLIPGVGRMRVLRPGSDAQVGALIDAFVAFAMLDNTMSTQEADIILDMLRSAFPEVDHAWLRRRMQRAVKTPRPLQNLATELKHTYDSPEKLALGLQLYTLVDAAGTSDKHRSSFEVFMRRLGCPDYGTAIMSEMRSLECNDDDLPFERLIFGNQNADIALPPDSDQYIFRIYRAGDLILLRNTGPMPLWIRGRSVEQGSFIRLRERQPLVLPGWTLNHEDIVFFLDAKLTGNDPRIFVEMGHNGIVAERHVSRSSEIKIRFGLDVTLEALRDTRIASSSHGLLKPGKPVVCKYHEKISCTNGVVLSMNELRAVAIQSGRRFRLTGDKQEYLVSNDPSQLSRGDLLIGQNLSPKTTLFIRYDAQAAAGKVIIRDSHGTIQVDGVAVKNMATLHDGSLIRLSHRQAIRCRFSEGFIDEERTLIESLKIENLTHDFGPGTRALDHIDFEVQRGEMLCIMGPSGSGKSTLLATLSGQKRPTSGKIKLNRASLYSNRNALVPYIAHMPQEEALNPQLTVREHLRHAITIRRPDLSFAEHERRVDSILAELGLQKLAHRRVGSPGEKTLSGGERSRLNLGLDLASRAEVFLFDEPISGLSSKDSEHVTETLKSLAKEKIVIASLHRPGAQVLHMFDKVLLLDSGGRVAFFGSPTQMVEYFREACRELEISHPSIDSHAPSGADFVFDVLEAPLSPIGNSSSGGARRFPSTFWQERFESTSLMDAIKTDQAPISRLSRVEATSSLPEASANARMIHSEFAIFATHFLRSFFSKLRNRGTAYSALIEAPLLAGLVSITLRSSPQGSYDFSSALHIPAYLFLSATVAMFLGLTNSATEILRDRAVIRRERNYHISSFSYVTAKFLSLSIIASAQCLVYLIVGNHFLEIEGMLLSHWGWMSLTAWTGTGMALVVSALVKSERAALTAVPLLLVPQMLLAGALVPYKEMNRGLFEDASQIREKGGIPVPAHAMPLRYAYEGMIVTQATRNPFEIERIRMQRKIDQVRRLDGDLSKEGMVRFELSKEGLRRLLASGATDKATARALVKRIRKTALGGTRLEIESMKIWPEGEKDAKPTSHFFVNERIDLMVREAETFRNDYRNKTNRNVFLALKKPYPWFANEKPTYSEHYEEPQGMLETYKYCAFTLGLFIIACLSIAMLAVFRQTRITK